jgi:hypothetical protein
VICAASILVTCLGLKRVGQLALVLHLSPLSFEVRSAGHRIKTWTKEFEQRAIERSTLRRRMRERRENTNLEELQ